MLTELHIENLGVIERADLVFGPGLTAITGETGAGKTMLVEALSLVVGGRADPIAVRYGADEARIDARFVRGDDEIVLTRVLPASGRSRAYVDGRPATAASLAEAATELVDLHGQHAHQRLLSPTSQRAALDTYGEVGLGALRAARARLTEIHAELAAFGGDERERARELDLARFQLAELEAAGIHDPDEDARLEATEDVLADASAHRKAGTAAYESFAADGGARDAVAAALAVLAGRSPYRELHDRVADLLAELDDIGTGVRDAAEAIDEDPERLAEIRQRRQLLVDLRRKYGADLADVMAYHRSIAGRVEELETFDARAAALDVERAEADDVARRAAADVRAARFAAAKPLAAAVTAGLHRLAMPNTSVEVVVGDDGSGDAVEFMLAANPGTPLLPFAKVASGGELARTMLALRLAMLKASRSTDGETVAGTLIFDEVDAGIGGSAGSAVGAALHDVGERYQVLVVTHLPQVAAAADTQISVVKHVVGGATTTSVETLRGDARVAEVARMLSGADGGEAARTHAAELLAR